MNKTILGVLGVAIIVVLGIFFLSKNNQTASPTETPSTTTSTDSAEPSTTESGIVTYSDSGFSPVSLTVKVGDTVNFKNQANISMWVASDPHPVHTTYPEFDAKKEVAVGGTYEFTFTKTGTWKYHNHLNPSDTGTIIVK